jgi:flagellar motor switch protein FliG
MPRKPNEKLPSSAEQLEGLTKAAMLLLAVGPDKAASVLKFLAPEAVEEVTRELAGLGRVPSKLQEEVVSEFYQITIANQYANEGNLEYAKKLLMDSLNDPKAAERMLGQILFLAAS